MVSPYPKKDELYSAGTSGVASYAKNIASHMTGDVVVLADYEKKPEIYEEGNVLVVRCFKRNNPRMWMDILKTLQKIKSTKKILIQYDFAVYGNVLTTFTVLPFLSLLKILGYQTSVVVHHVVVDVFKLQGHLGLRDTISDKMKGKLFNQFFHIFYKILGMLADNIIVLEEALKKMLGKMISSEKVFAVPHGVDIDMIPQVKTNARKALGFGDNEYVVMFFGYVNWFKGADFFVDAFSDVKNMLGKKVRFVLAGGESPTMKNRGYYQDYFSEILRKIYSSHNIEMTGYIPQNQIASYFAAADLVILPYRNFMTASGVLSLIFSYKKPFIISEELKGMFESEDFIDALSRSGLNIEDVVFQLNKKSCIMITEKVLKNGLKEKMIHMAELIREKRAYENTALKYANIMQRKSVYTLPKPLALNYTKS